MSARRRRLRRASLAAALASALPACTTSTVDLAYAPPHTTAAQAAAYDGPAVAVGGFADARGRPANWLGSIRGGFGRPVKTLVTPGPVSGVVREAFADGLAARGMLARGPGAPYTLKGTVQAFDCAQFVRREATARVLVELVEARTGRPVLARAFEDRVAGGGFTLATGVFGSVEALRAVASRVLQRAVDKALDDPGLRAALGRAAPPQPNTTRGKWQDTTQFGWSTTSLIFRSAQAEQSM